MRRIVLLCTVLLIGITTGFAANVEREYNVDNFNGISLLGASKVFVSYGKSIKVAAEGPEELIEKFDVYVDGKNLVIKPKNNVKIKTSRDYYVHFFVEMPSVGQLLLLGSGDIILKEEMTWAPTVEIRVSGSGDIEVEQVSSKKMEVTVNGSGDVEIDKVDVQNVELSVLGSGDIKVKELLSSQARLLTKGSGDIEIGKGQVNQVSYEVIGSSDIKAEKLKADHVTVQVKGSGDVKCYAKESIRGNVFGSGDVSYGGKPTQVDVSKKGFRIAR